MSETGPANAAPENGAPGKKPLTATYLAGESINYPFRNWRFMLAKPVLWTLAYWLMMLFVTGGLFLLLGGWDLMAGFADLIELPDEQLTQRMDDLFHHFLPFYVAMFALMFLFLLFYYAKIYALLYSHMWPELGPIPFLMLSRTELNLWLTSLILLGIWLIAMGIWWGLLTASAALPKMGFLTFLFFLALIVAAPIVLVRLATFFPRAARGDGIAPLAALRDTRGLTGTLLGAGILVYLVMIGISTAVSFVALPIQIGLMSTLPVGVELSPEDRADALSHLANSAGFWGWLSAYIVVSVFIQGIVGIVTIAFGARFTGLVYERTVGRDTAPDATAEAPTATLSSQ